MRLLAFAIIALALSLPSLLGSTAFSAVPPKLEEKKPVVFVKKAALSELSETLTYPARIEPRIKASVLAESDGVVTKITSPLGSQVKAHSALMTIRNTDPVYRYAPMTVTAPVSGVVSRVEVTEGSRVSKGDKLALVTDPNQVRVVVEVTADDVRTIQNGQEAKLTIPGAVDGATILLKVKGISPFVDPATGTALCELETANSKLRLPPPGAIARVSFKSNIRQGISILDSALTYRGRDPFVRIVDAGKAKLVPVTIGRKQAGYVEILKGLKTGDTIVERTSKFVRDGEAVEVQEKSVTEASQG